MEEFLQFFVDWNGPKALVNKLRCMTDEEKIKDLVLFINELVEDDQVAKDFLNEKLHIWFVCYIILFGFILNYFLLAWKKSVQNSMTQELSRE